jgi:Na+-translocating ferredoxin:NAD+ oxidoreductase RnfG subunit
LKIIPITSSLLSLLGPVISVQAHCEIYMSDEQAVALLMPQKTLKKTEIELTPEEVKAIEKSSGQEVRSKKLKVWKNENDFVFIDQVLGKHEFITYAVGLSQAKVTGIEILEYRETYGQQIKKPEWRAQFAGKNISSKLKLNDDIQNLSGATLSSSHVTAGVKRVLQTYDLIKNRL